MTTFSFYSGIYFFWSVLCTLLQVLFLSVSQYCVVLYHYSTAEEQKIEAVEKQATKVLPGFKNLNYLEHLKALNLPTLHYHRLHSKVVLISKVWKTIREPG